MEKIKTRIRELREEKGLTQEQLGEEIGFRSNTISQYETGVLEPNLQTIKKLCDFFDVSADYLLGFKEF
ncbi:MAG: helix-turn-helix transcriptional regulator [Firmicutes bacterium]|nr:helix-turn-helix transcriptional regulator [Bacillota bacterium]